MAIIGNLEVTITSGGKVLREYGVAEEDQVDREGDPKAQRVGRRCKKVSTVMTEKCFAYVEATPDANFEIGYKMSGKLAFGRASHIIFGTSVDGHDIISPSVDKEEYQKSGAFSSVDEGDMSTCGSETNLHRFYWAPLSTTDDNPKVTVAELKAEYGSKGTIRVDVWRRQRLPSIPHDRATPAISSDIPERALKGRAVEVGVSFRNAKQIAKVNFIYSKPVDKEPLATFVFFYRSKNALQALDLIPRTPEPVPLEERDEETLNPAEMLELIRRQKASNSLAWMPNLAERKAEKVKIKQEKAEANLRQLAGLKREAGALDDEDISIVVQSAKKTRREVAVVELLD
ncbi:hypothetical protein G647_06757 [Cladophialophora carrionii CBS 160.54]|uniref:DUF7918 domain-containing protein n=1 Tax=Cladophialophora carrionii CBS 160.54 TaxID=1279043 RepID=V9D7N7_9EURO|nr:uncharacterized protein G647_06757 [Cladophialophora carrionii CBS 160.54]ETI22681.1 hypothetical protein G647_06757 [Cladophialophora carrionii CBS 160.54]